MPLYRRLEFATLGVMIGSFLVIVMGIVKGGEDQYINPGMWTLGTTLVVWITLKIANHDRAAHPG